MTIEVQIVEDRAAVTTVLGTTYKAENLAELCRDLVADELDDDAIVVRRTTEAPLRMRSFYTLAGVAEPHANARRTLRPLPR
jgi:hypothetical protein